MVLTDAQGLPLAIDIEAANHAEVKLIEPLLDAAVTTDFSEKLIYDKAADSDPLRRSLASRVPISSIRTAAIAFDMQPKTVESSDATAADGLSNVPSVGCMASKGSSFVTNSTRISFTDSLNSLVLSSPVGGYETDSSVDDNLAGKAR